MSQNNYVFVYGTLKKGFPNNRMLKSSKYLTRAQTLEKYSMKGTYFPYVIEGGDSKGFINGELYKVKDTTLKALDILEGVNHNHYERKLVNVLGLNTSLIYTCFMYLATEETAKCLEKTINIEPKEGELAW